MGEMPLVLAVALATYITRVAGFGLARRPIPAVFDRFLVYVPVAAFAALITPGLEIGTLDMVPRVAGLAIAGALMLRWRKLWAGLAGGMAGFWVTSLLLTGGIN